MLVNYQSGDNKWFKLTQPKVLEMVGFRWHICIERNHKEFILTRDRAIYQWVLFH